MLSIDGQDIYLMVVAIFVTLLTLLAWCLADRQKRLDPDFGSLPVQITGEDMPAGSWLCATHCYFPMLVIIFVVIPVVAKSADVIDCERRYPWAYHLIAYIACSCGSTLEAWWYHCSPIKPFGLFPLLKAHVVGMLVKLDLFMDMIFPSLAFACDGGWPYALASIILLLVGVCCFQWVAACVVCCGLGMGSGIDQAHNAIVVITECIGFKFISSEVLEYSHFANAGCAASRCFCEDLGQNVVKILFLRTRPGGINYQIVLNVCLSMSFSMISVDRPLWYAWRPDGFDKRVRATRPWHGLPAITLGRQTAVQPLPR